MKKRPTDFSQISLLSNQKAKLIYLKNSKENNEHVKLCKSFELQKHGIKASHGKKKKDLEKRLERHYQDSLNVEDIKCLRKFVGDARDENEFCSQFYEAGRTRRTRSSSVLHNKKGRALTREMVRSSFIGDLGKDMEFTPNEQTNFQKQDNTNNSTDMPQMEERDFNLSAQSDQPSHSNHARSSPEQTIDANTSKTRSPKVQRENIVEQNRNEMLSGLTAISTKADIFSWRTRFDGVESSREAETGEGENCRDENNNCTEGKVCPQENSSRVSVVSKDQEKTFCNAEGVDQSDVSCESKGSGNGTAFGQQSCEKRKESKKGPVILKRLGPTPNEYEEDVEDGALQDGNGATEKPSPKQRTASMTQVIYDRISMEKPREMLPVAGNDPPLRRRRSSWAGRSNTERLFKREFPEALPHLNRTYEAGNGAGRPGLDNSDKASQKSFDAASIDAYDCRTTGGEHLVSGRNSGCESLESMKRHMLSFQKSNSVPMGLGSRPKIYSEEPFYMRPRRLSRRPSWQSTKLSEETLKGLQAIADKAKSDDTMMDEPEPEPETPLVSILPPITLQSIYAQQCSKEKRDQELHERKQRGTNKKTGDGREITLDMLSDRLKDCRYLRFRKDAGL